MEIRAAVEAGSYAAVFRIARTNAALLLIVIIGNLALSLALDAIASDEMSETEILLALAGSLAMVLLWSLWSFSAYATALTDQPGHKLFTAAGVAKFFWRDLLIFAASFFVALALSIALAGDDASESTGLAFSYGVGIPVVLLLNAAIGTWFAAVVVGSNPSPGMAWARSRGQIGRTFLGLLLLAGPFALAMVAAYFNPGSGLIAGGSIAVWDVLRELVGSVFEAGFVVAIAAVVSRLFLATD